MASEKAKELARKQKAEVQAEKLRKKNSDDPKDWGQVRQIREMFKLVRQQNPRFPFILGAAVLGPIVLAIILAAIIGWWGLLIPLGILVGFALGMFLFNREIRKATYSRVEGQAGSSFVALQMLPKEWVTSQTPINGNREQDIILRTVGPAGIVLVGDGDARRVRMMLNSEVKRHSNVQHKVTVIPIVMGDGEGQVPLKNLTEHIKKLPKKYDSAGVSDLANRVVALDNVRPRMGGMPRGPVNTRGAHKAMRGR